MLAAANRGLAALLPLVRYRTQCAVQNGRLEQLGAERYAAPWLLAAKRNGDREAVSSAVRRLRTVEVRTDITTRQHPLASAPCVAVSAHNCQGCTGGTEVATEVDCSLQRTAAPCFSNSPPSSPTPRRVLAGPCGGGRGSRAGQAAGSDGRWRGARSGPQPRVFQVCFSRLLTYKQSWPSHTQFGFVRAPQPANLSLTEYATQDLSTHSKPVENAVPSIFSFPFQCAGGVSCGSQQH